MTNSSPVKCLGVAVVLAASAALGGCANADQDRSSAVGDPRSRPDLSVLDRLGDADCDVYPSPQSLAAVAPIVLRGTVRAVRSGPSVLEPDLPGELRRSNHMVFKVDVDEVVKGADLLGADQKHAYVAMGRGINSVDVTTGKVPAETDPNPSIVEIDEAIPVGTRVAVFTSPFTWTTTGKAHFAQKDAGRPAGAKLLGGFVDCGRGMNFDPGVGSVSAWNMTFEDLDAAIDKLS